MRLKDIAEKVGVSTSTVSRVLNDRETKAASRKVKEKVWQAVREAGYTPDEAARELRGKRQVEREKRYIACVYARVTNHRVDSFFSQLAAAIEYELFKNGYVMKYSIYAGEMDVETISNILAGTEVDGIIVMGRFFDEQLRATVEKMPNVVYVSLSGTESVNHDVVFSDAYKAARSVMGEFFRLGHRQIAYVGEKRREMRYAGYRDAMQEQGLRELSVDAEQTMDGGYTGMETLLCAGDPFTAVFCANDEAAMGAIKALRGHGKEVPRDVSVISVDDIDVASYFSPMLTTVHIPINELGRQAARVMVDRISNARKIALRLELPSSLSRRDSSREK